MNPYARIHQLEKELTIQERYIHYLINQIQTLEDQIDASGKPDGTREISGAAASYARTDPAIPQTSH